MLMTTDEECNEHLYSIDKYVYNGNGTGCNGTFDGVICWEAAAAGATVKVQCPQFEGVFDTTKTLYKHCLPNSFWEGYNTTNKYSGHTDFNPCLTEAVLRQTKRFKDVNNSTLIYNIVAYIELVGIILSVICICLSLFIFFYHKSLRCKRTKIHLNLFVAILLQSLLRLVFFIDRFLFNVYQSNSVSFESFFMSYSKSICPILTGFLEYLQLCNFMWMLNEGVYLNVLLTYSIFDNNKTNLIIAFYVVGWGLPAVISLAWGFTLYKQIGIDDICWFGYYERSSYWIIQGPILSALIINIFCLANVLRILAKKLRENKTNDVDQIKKSAKAAILLLPLLGITHIFEVYHGEPENWVINLIYSVINAILVFNQGVFLSVLYCFMNNEVKNVIRRHWLGKFEFKLLCFNSQRFRSRNRANSEINREGRRLVDEDIHLTEMTTITKTNLMSNTETSVV